MDKSRINRLAKFVDWCATHIKGDEKGEAQIFLDRLFIAFGQRGCLDVGGTPEFRIRKSKEDGGGTAFADYVWKPVVLIEMKKRGENLARHRRQAFDYWVRLVPDRPAYVVLCNFDEFLIYDFNALLDEPMDRVSLAELPEHYGPLAFLFPTREKPHFRIDRIAVTRGAADLLAQCHGKLKDRSDVGPDTAQRFILQMLIALFSEDIGLLPKYFVAELLNECTDPPKAFDLLGGLFRAMNNPRGAGGGRYKDVSYFNGGIFAEPAPVELGSDEAEMLRHAAEYNWSQISPDIFGTIFQHSMDKDERHKYGGYYTTPADIMKIVGPTIVEPWRALIDAARSVNDLRALHQRLASYRVLDPACGSGNFLYIAYRELKRIEARIIERLSEIAPSRYEDQRAFSFVTSRQFFGMDIIPFAVELAKVTMTLGHKLAIDELHIEEAALPLDNLDENITCRDALIDKSGALVKWPAADVIIGNPPFLGAKRLKPEHGADYVNAVRKAFPDVPGMADYCVYWIRRAHDNLPPCRPDDPVAGRAGLVGTQNIRNNKSREGGLDHVVKTGVVVEAVDNQPWSGEANVHVSIVNWVKLPPPEVDVEGRVASIDPKRLPKTLADKLLIPAKRKLWQKVEPSLPLFDKSDGKRRRTRTPGKRSWRRKDKSFELIFHECPHINSALSYKTDVSGAKVLTCNERTCYTGQYPRHKGFMLNEAQAKGLRWRSENSEVIWPFFAGAEVLTQESPDRYVIDFQIKPILEAQKHPAPFKILQTHVLPHIERKAASERATTGKETGQDQNWLRTWWQHFRPRPELIGKISSLARYVACSRVTKRPIFVFLSPEIRPGDALSCFCVDDDYSFGILQSNVHWQWFIEKCSKLKSDFRYTPESVFDTYPWPQSPTVEHINAVAETGREVRRIREEALKKIHGGLRAVYRTLELPGKNPLKDAHAALNEAIMNAYGFDPKDDLLRQILELNYQVAARIDRGADVTAPGIPPNYPEPEQLVTDDCIQP